MFSSVSQDCFQRTILELKNLLGEHWSLIQARHKASSPGHCTKTLPDLGVIDALKDTFSPEGGQITTTCDEARSECSGSILHDNGGYFRRKSHRGSLTRGCPQPAANRFPTMTARNTFIRRTEECFRHRSRRLWQTQCPGPPERTSCVERICVTEARSTPEEQFLPGWTKLSDMDVQPRRLLQKQRDNFLLRSIRVMIFIRGLCPFRHVKGRELRIIMEHHRLPPKRPYPPISTRFGDIEALRYI